MARYSDRCPACHREVGVERFHAGFGDQGFMYCDRDSTILTWDSLDPSWTSLVGEVHPWMLSPEQKAEVEGVAPGCPCGGRFRFSNVPHCPLCSAPVPSLSPGGAYFVVLGDRIDATGAWPTEPSG